MVGGRVAPPGRFPYVVSLQREENYEYDNYQGNNNDVDDFAQRSRVRRHPRHHGHGPHGGSLRVHFASDSNVHHGKRSSSHGGTIRGVVVNVVVAKAGQADEAP